MNQALVHIIGIGAEPDDISVGSKRIIGDAEVLVGGSRIMEFFSNHPAHKIIIKSPLEKIIDIIIDSVESEKNVCVLTSGDPGFYSIGELLCRKLGQDMVVIHPGPTIVQILAAKLKIGWKNAKIISLHGRSTDNLNSDLNSDNKVFIYTDANNTPAVIGQILVDSGQKDRRMIIAERLGLDDENISEMTALDASERLFDPLNLVLILPETQLPPDDFRFGLPESMFQSNGGLITKSEIRAVVLGKLGLKSKQVVWDMGAGSGSVGIETARLFPDLSVYAIEKNSNRIKDIQSNIDRFGLKNITSIHGHLPDIMSELPDPDRVFIGGGGIFIEQITEKTVERLRSGGIVVACLATVESFDQVWNVLEQNGFTVDGVQMQTGRIRKIAGRKRIEAINPVFIIQGVK